MKASPHLVRVYLKTCRRYRKVASKLNRQALSAYQRNSFLQELRKLLRRLRHLRLQLRLAAAAGTVALTLNLNTAAAQTEGPGGIGPFVLQDRSANPLRDPIFNGRNIAAVDLDGDGDYDIVAGEYYYSGGFLRYFENLSSEGKPLFIERLDDENPFSGITSQSMRAAPAFADIDNDGDMDLFIGQGNGWVVAPNPYTDKRGIEYYRNDGGTFTHQTGLWDPVTKQGNPFDTLGLGFNVTPVFVDFDHDGDSDLIAGSVVAGGAPYYTPKYIHYYVNDGQGIFQASELTLNTEPVYYGGDEVNPALADIDGDGDYDLVVGNYQDGGLRYYAQDTPGNFIEQTQQWDPLTKTGHPFYWFNVGWSASPLFVDFDNDGFQDLFVADQPGYLLNKYSDRIINYYHNSDNGVFEEKDEFENPFDGVYVMLEAAPVLFDIDGDGDLDAVVGNKYSTGYYDENQQYISINSSLAYYQNTNGDFKRITGETNPFDTLEVVGPFAPQFVDVDGDGDTDMISGNAPGDVIFFRNTDGVYKQDKTPENPFNNVAYSFNTCARLVDIDGDTDLDLFLSTNNEIHYFKNTGTRQAPVYTEFTESDNPLDSAQHWQWGTPFFEFADLDHDGDTDVVMSGANPIDEGRSVLFVENTGTSSAPVFNSFHENLLEGDGDETHFSLVDFDQDGDLDIFAGLEYGIVHFYRNENQPVTTNLTNEVPLYKLGDPPLTLDPDLDLDDPDTDLIVRAVVTIQDYQPGERLGFKPRAGITGSFDSSTGVLTFTGKATAEEYALLLRTVTFEVTESSGRQRRPYRSLADRSVSFAVYDVDFTNPPVATKSLQIFSNDPPAIGSGAVQLTVGTSATVDLKELASDPNGSGDLDFGTLKVTQPPASGAATSIDASGTLTVDYAGLNFQGTETLTVEVCDLAGACAQNTVTVTVTNSPPVISPQPVSTPAGSSKAINLLSITTDADGNLDPSTFVVTKPPVSGARATIEQTSESVVNLVLDYNGITFHGTDEVSIKVCDKAGACTESALSVEVDFDARVMVYNAIAPNSVGDNRFMRITGLPASNKVSIFNRWGDKVFETENYRNDPSANAFKGLNNDGNALPSGTYFYTIEIPGEKEITGYLTLKQ